MYHKVVTWDSPPVRRAVCRVLFALSGRMSELIMKC